MREEKQHTESVFDELSKASTASTRSESYDLLTATFEDEGRPIEHELDELMAQVNDSLPVDDIQFDEAIIKENLEEILLMLIALHGETHGKEILSDLTHLFDAQLSPGTVYPGLHKLEEEDVLSMHAKVRTKEYSIADTAFVRATIEQTMLQHLAFGLLLYAFLPRLEPAP
ncbi:PadR family transcriptional regulator [Natronobiforma cellulositropha]|uniref:PadR family transcriptional regulator n=1 Tax=Natronobiforma cellulositropha TaxID=1679076 RepID=UPI0021D6113F|nr:PadR family transcriptional regulator [Natronobiforma cellulositropha]